jgi:hypothetical protein
LSVSRSAYWCVLVGAAVAFFAASRLLPPVVTGGVSNAVAAGFTNQLLPLVGILLVGAVVMGLIRWRTGPRDNASAATSTPAPFWRSQILAAAVFSAAVIVIWPSWSAPNGYFGIRVTLMDAGRRPYVDFEYAYGFLVAWLPHWLHAAGLSIQRALEVTLALLAIAGVGAAALVTRRWVAQPGARMALFWSLVVCGVLVRPGPSLNYNFGRYAVPFALAILLVDRAREGGWRIVFAATAAANVLVYGVSPEMGCAFTAAMTVWLATSARSIALPALAAGLAGLALSTVALVVFEAPMFATLLSYAGSQILQPVVPNPIMLLFVVSFLAVEASAVASTLVAWRGRADSPSEAEWRACAALAAALLPAVIGRAFPTITLAYGFAPIVMLAGRRLAARRRAQGYALASVFIAFVAYSAAPTLAEDLRSLVGHRRCAAADCARRVSRLDRPTSYPADLRARFPRPYDPFAIVPITAPLAAEVGYYPGLGLGNVTTRADLARKMGELSRAGVYILPTDRRMAAAGHDPSRLLARYARASLYPLPLPVLRAEPDPERDFAARLYNLCQPLAQSEAIVVCTPRPAAAHPAPLGGIAGAMAAIWSEKFDHWTARWRSASR